MKVHTSLTTFTFFMRFGARKVRRHLSIVLVSILLVLADRLSELPSPSSLEHPKDALRFSIDIISNWKILAILILGVALKAALIVATNIDLLTVGLVDSRHRAVAFRQSLISRAALINIVFCLSWYLSFSLIAAATISAASFIFPSVFVTWLACVSIALLLFPIFYAGFSIQGFILSVRHLGASFSYREAYNTIMKKRWAVYSFFALRSLFESATMLIVFGVLRSLDSGIFGLVAKAILLSILIAIMRAATMSYKLELFSKEHLAEGFAQK
jgi:hypothetical protein